MVLDRDILSVDPETIEDTVSWLPISMEGSSTPRRPGDVEREEDEKDAADCGASAKRVTAHGYITIESGTVWRGSRSFGVLGRSVVDGIPSVHEFMP